MNTLLFIPQINKPLLRKGWKRSFLILFFPFFAFTQGDSAPKNYDSFLEVAPYAQSDLYWAYNTLISLEDDATLIISNENELNILKYVQSNQKLNQNVIISTLEESKNANFDFFSKKNTYVTLSIDQNTKEKLKSKSYLTGLAFKLSETPFDNTTTLKNNVEQNFLLDYLKVNFEETNKPALISKSVYLVPLSVLYRHYKSEKSNSKAENMRFILESVATQTGNEKILLSLLGESQNAENESFSSIIPYKNLEKGMVKLAEKLYVSEVETTNASYNLFLQDLLNHKEFDKINICKSEKVDWRNLLEPKHKMLSDALIFPYGKPEDDKCPIQNITYEAAVLYCEWITKSYNNNSNTKKKFNKVVFRLPSEQEWEKAAHGNNLMPMKYPTSNHFQNEKGCYLNNYNIYSEKYPCAKCSSGDAKDGAHFPVQTDYYYPNSIGIYNTSGNIAEMISEKGKAKGGSWEDIPENCTIQSVKNYEKPSPAIGFRVFMEIQ